MAGPWIDTNVQMMIANIAWRTPTPIFGVAAVPVSRTTGEATNTARCFLHRYVNCTVILGYSEFIIEWIVRSYCHKTSSDGDGVSSRLVSSLVALIAFGSAGPMTTQSDNSLESRYVDCTSMSLEVDVIQTHTPHADFVISFGTSWSFCHSRTIATMAS